MSPTDDPRIPPGPSREEVGALMKEIAGQLGGTSYFIDEIDPSPFRRVGPQEWRLPDELDGRPLQKLTQSGPRWVRETPRSRQVLVKLGLSASDLIVYGAFPAHPDPDAYAAVMAYVAPFLDPPRALDLFKTIFQAPGTVWRHARLGSLPVECGTSAEWGPMATIYLWADVSCVYQVVSSDLELARRLAEAVTPFTSPEPTDG